MTTFSKVAPIYGYLVCLTAIIASFIALNMLVNALFNWQDPLHASDYTVYSPRDLSSFEAYKLDANSASPASAASDTKIATTYTLTDEQLKTAYAAAKDNKITAVRFNAKRNITNAVIILIFSAVLFGSHWRWVNKQRDAVA